MKTSTAVIAGVLALAVIGGGTAYAMSTTDDQPEAVVQTESPAPQATEPTPETTESVTPEEAPTPESTPTEGVTVDESEFLHGARQIAAFGGFAATDAELLEMGQQVCAEREAGVEREDSAVLADQPDGIRGSFRQQSIDFLCPAG